VALDFLRAYGHLDVADASPGSFDESDLRRANRGGARISAVQIGVILERRIAVEGALGAIPVEASLTGSVPWARLRELFDTFAEIGGVGFAKMTKALHPKRPALIPILDSVVQRYLADDDVGASAPFSERALALARSYGRDVDANGPALGALREELARRGYELTEVRILDLLIWRAATA
jgi:hypothetical protein